jgi:hypothetical protein|tara:strand:- start:70 stop:291 length:222 start_codon:yes stop_codon:yes gene_type:complete
VGPEKYPPKEGGKLVNWYYMKIPSNEFLLSRAFTYTSIKVILGERVFTPNFAERRLPILRPINKDMLMKTRYP